MGSLSLTSAFAATITSTSTTLSPAVVVGLNVVSTPPRAYNFKFGSPYANNIAFDLYSPNTIKAPLTATLTVKYSGPLNCGYIFVIATRIEPDTITAGQTKHFSVNFSNASPSGFGKIAFSPANSGRTSIESVIIKDANGKSVTASLSGTLDNAGIPCTK